MAADELTKALIELREEAHETARAELADLPGAADRRERAGRIRARLAGLGEGIDLAPVNERPELEDLRRAVERYLVLFAVDETTTRGSQTLLERAQALHVEILDLARAMLQSPGTGAAGKVDGLRRRVDELLRLPGADAPDVQRILADADLDVEFIRHGGQAPSSLRLARELRP